MKSNTQKDNNLLKVSFKRENYLIMAVGLLLITIGYILMIGGGNEDPEVFNDAIFNTQRMIVSPLLLVAGYSLQIYAIFYKKKES